MKSRESEQEGGVARPLQYAVYLEAAEFIINAQTEGIRSQSGTDVADPPFRTSALSDADNTEIKVTDGSGIIDFRNSICSLR